MEDTEAVDEPSYDINEILSDLTINGVSIDWSWYDLYSDNNKVGEIWVSEDNSIVALLSLSYSFNYDNIRRIGFYCSK